MAVSTLFYQVQSQNQEKIYLQIVEEKVSIGEVENHFLHLQTQVDR